MPTLPVPFDEIKKTVAAWHEALDAGWPAEASPTGSALSVTIRALGLGSGSRASVAIRLDTAVALGIQVREWRLVDPQWAADQVRRYKHYDETFNDAQAAFNPPAAGAPPRSSGPGRRVSAHTPPPRDATPSGQGMTKSELTDAIMAALRRGPATTEELRARFNTTVGHISAAIYLARNTRSAPLSLRSGRWHLDATPAMGHQREGDVPYLQSDSDGVIRFAAVGDTHLCSKYAREDCLADFYDHVEKRGLKIVLHAGNWIDGEATFNRHDLLVHGMDAQMQYLAKNYPQRPGVETWAITGEDHEGWYSRREGVDVGRYAENVMRQNGRTDWRDMGFMENFIDLVHGETGKSCKLLLMHPGGGSAYAVSYAPQKIVEGFDGGDKPAVLLLGHYHKASYNLIRNVHTVQTGCFEDQTVFMRKQKIAAHLAGCFIELRLDPETGAVIEFTTTFRNYFVRDYYRGRWSQHGPVNHAPRRA